MIKPTVGLAVWYYPHGRICDDDLPRAATIAYVHSDTSVNIGYLDRDGDHYSASSVRLVREREVVRQGERCCELVPHQLFEIAPEAVTTEHDAGVSDSQSVTQPYDPLQAIIEERAEIEGRMRKLVDYQATPEHAQLTSRDKGHLLDQFVAMRSYAYALTARIGSFV
jgi:hypothetical protein